MTIKSLSRKQIILPMNNDNKIKFIKDSCNHVTNINRALKSIKSEVIVDFIHLDQSEVIIVTNKVASSLDLQTIESYIKSAKHIIAEGVEVLQILKSKSYIKIIDISYLRENTNTPITSEVIEEIFKKIISLATLH